MKGKNNRRFSRFVSIGLIATLTASFCVGILQSPIADRAIFSSFAAESSQNEIAFEFDENKKTLTLSGRTEMSDFTAQDCAPWSQYSDSAEKIVIEDGIKSLGDNAFVSFSDLQEVNVPQSVTAISDKAFVDCNKDFTVKGMTDSEAQKFAKNNQYKFEAVGAVSASDAISPSDVLTAADAPDSETNAEDTAVPADPTIPTNVTVTCEAYNKLKISWNKVDGAAGYYLYCSTSENGKYSIARYIIGGNTTEFVHSSRSYEKTYYYKVKSYKVEGRQKVFSPDSETVSGMTHVDPPAVVQNVKVTCTAYNQLSVSWDKVDGAKGYYVYYADAPDGKYRLVRNVTRNTITSLLHSWRKLGATYYYKVISYDKAGYKAICADESAVASCTTYLHTPAAPTVTAKSDSNIYVTFAKVSGAYKYNLYRSVDGGEFTQIAVITGRYTDKNTIPGKIYAYKLASVRGNIVTDCSDDKAAVCTLSIPKISTAYSTGADSIALKWGKVNGAGGYAIYLSTDENGTYKHIGSVNSRTYQFTASGLDTGTRYYFKISAYKTVSGEDGYSDMSNTVSCVPVIPKTRILSTQAIGRNSVYIESYTVAGADGYKFYRSDSANGEYVKVGISEYCFYSDATVSAGHTYYYKVCGYKVVGDRYVDGALSDYKKVTVSTTLSAAKRGWSFSNKPLQKPIASMKENTKYGLMDAHFAGDTDRKVIYLNFSYGYATDTVNSVLDTLKDKNVKAGFFVTLNSVQKQQDSIRRMINEGHVVGNHTAYSDVSLYNISESNMKSQIDLVEDYLLKNYNYQTEFFSYPRGDFSLKGLDYVYNQGYTSIFWSYTYKDYGRTNVSDARAYRNLTQNIHPGAIYLLHVESRANANVLGNFIDYARSIGYEIEPIENLRNQ